MILDKKHAMQQKLFRQFAETEFTKELQEELDTTGAFNWDIHNKMAKYGFMGVKIPVEYGGAGGDYLSYVIMDEEPEQAVPYILYGLLAFIVVVCLGIMFPQVFGRKQ